LSSSASSSGKPPLDKKSKGDKLKELKLERPKEPKQEKGKEAKGEKTKEGKGGDVKRVEPAPEKVDLKQEKKDKSGKPTVSLQYDDTKRLAKVQKKQVGGQRGCAHAMRLFNASKSKSRSLCLPICHNTRRRRRCRSKRGWRRRLSIPPWSTSASSTPRVSSAAETPVVSPSCRHFQKFHPPCWGHFDMV
jgi:hypothetical protein